MEVWNWKQAEGGKGGRGNRVVLLADAAEVLVVLRLHELLSDIAAVVHQPLKETPITLGACCRVAVQSFGGPGRRDSDLGVGFELLELVELRRGVAAGVRDERVGVHGGVLAAGGLGVALGRRVVVVPPHLGLQRRLVLGGEVRVAPVGPRHVDPCLSSFLLAVTYVSS